MAKYSKKYYCKFGQEAQEKSNTSKKVEGKGI